jgi:hypothetical protein
MPAQNFSITANEQDGAIDSAAGSFVELNYTDYDIDSGVLGSPTKAICDWTGDFHSVRNIVRSSLVTQRRVMEEGIARQPSFTKRREDSSFLCGLFNQLAGLFCRGITIEIDRRCLNNREREFWMDRHSSSDQGTGWIKYSISIVIADWF